MMGELKRGKKGFGRNFVLSSFFYGSEKIMKHDVKEKVGFVD